jgi:ubiquinone biosynthesis accessory factor UbiJ
MTDAFRTSSPGPVPGFLHTLLSKMRPPEWVVDETQTRDRLRRQKGKRVRVQWGEINLTLMPTSAGLLERSAGNVKPDLSVTLTQVSPFELAQSVIAGDRPGVDIQGDVQLAAEVAWLVDNVRWDVEEDLSRILGDAAAHTLVRVGKSAVLAVKGFVRRGPGGLGVQISKDPSPVGNRGSVA